LSGAGANDPPWKRDCSGEVTSLRSLHTWSAAFEEKSSESAMTSSKSNGLRTPCRPRANCRSQCDDRSRRADFADLANRCANSARNRLPTPLELGRCDFFRNPTGDGLPAKLTFAVATFNET
jgi:hypothetical protein